ncbi:MAG: hypothetical protein QG604_494 [Candidatus Dependentiae bacterium]|nr:hypothetical protein [Candidatus Dependentiae bacterium]
MRRMYALWRDSGRVLFGYWLPELITLFVTVALPPLFDAYLVASLHSTTSYGALGMATNFLHTLVKLSEAIPVAAIAVIGRHNGAKNHAASGAHFINTLWTAIILGCAQLIIIYFWAHRIYEWLGVPADMAIIGTPFLRLRSVSVLLAFILLSVLGFMRAIKNTHTPMLITLIGSVVYMVSSVILVSGHWGFPTCGIYGPAFAALLEYGTMLAIALAYVFSNQIYKPYFINLKLFSINWRAIGAIVSFSIPVIIDKSALSFSYVWLSKMLATMGPVSIATFDIIKNLERSAIMPAAAFAQVVTMLVSNHLGAQEFSEAKKTIFKILLITCAIVSGTLIILSLYASYFIGLLSPNPEITDFAIPLLRILSCLVIFDFAQLILAAALRGAGKVKTVMWTRFLICGLFFLPISYILSQCSFDSLGTKFCLIYGAFYINTALMGIAFWRQLAKSTWYEKHI